MRLYHDFGKPCNDVKVQGTYIRANVWGRQERVVLTTWSEIRKLGFELRERAFGNLNDGTPALYFQAYTADNVNHWFLTTETIEQIKKEEVCI
ncbi:MAG: hypothetical protein IJ557_02305 [Bacteroidaceae bacterium]|nr:hypothetical protein [Bacteroidaceae bacterium]